jgi:hypothetical protein
MYSSIIHFLSGYGKKEVISSQITTDEGRDEHGWYYFARLWELDPPHQSLPCNGSIQGYGPGLVKPGLTNTETYVYTHPLSGWPDAMRGAMPDEMA